MTWRWAPASLGALSCAVAAALVVAGFTGWIAPAQDVLAAVRMWVSPGDADVQMRGCRAVMLRSLVDPDSRDLLVAAGGLSQAFRAMGTFPFHKELQKVCMDAIAAVSQWRPDITATAIQLGALEQFVQSTARFIDDPGMQKAAALGHLLVRSADSRLRWAAAGGIEVLVASARRHYRDPFVQFQAWCAFAAGTAEPNELRFWENGGVELAVGVMRDHAGSHRVREHAMAALRAVSTHSDELRSAVVRSGFVDTAVGAMLEAPLDLHQQAIACGNFAGLGEGNESHRSALLIAGVVDTAVAAVRSSARMWSPAKGQGMRYSVRGECLKALETLAASGAARHVVALSVTRDDLVSAMRWEPEDWKVQTAGSALLRILED
mmetsp:Transcript_43116/g.134068  ORF Transcript_43116/g.134068 Transcript_43116/m.134068 type:complete len:378 (-) Transcript_43116:87-1220(-)